MELTLMLSMEGKKLKDLLPQVVEIVDRYIW
jgi:hypothetical protein